MSLYQLWRMIFASRWAVLMCVAASLAGAMVISLRLPKSYESKARVILELIRADPVTGIIIRTKQTEAYVQTQQLLATSDRVAERVVDKLGWTTNPAVVGAWTEQTGGVGDIRAWAANRLLSEVGAYPLEGGGILELVYRAPDPDASETIVRLIRESYIEVALALQTEAAARRAKRFEELTKPAQAALSVAEAALVKAQRETGTLVDPRGNDIDRDKLDQLRTVAATADIAARERIDSAQRDRSTGVTARLRQELLETEQAIARAGTSLGNDNPQYRALLERRALVAGQLSAAGAQARASAANAVAAARRLAREPEVAYQDERERVLGQADANLRIGQAVRLVTLRRGELVRLQTNLANARVSADRTESGLVVMGDVISNSNPVSPDIPLNALLAVLFGLGIGLAWAMIDGLSRREVRGTADLANAAGVPVLVVLPPGRRARWQWPARLSLRRRGGGLAPSPA